MPALLAMMDKNSSDDVRSPLLRCALNTVEEAFLVCKSEGEILQWNSSLEETTGYSGAEISEMTPGDLTGEKAWQIERHAKEADEADRTQFKSYLDTKDEGRIPYTFTASLTNREESTLIFLAGREERYHRIFEEALEGIAITTPDGSILEANPAARKMFGFTEEELPTLNLTNLYADPEKREEIVETLRREGIISQQEVRLKTAGGKVIICELSVTVQSIQTGPGEKEPARHLAFVRDVTERKRAEEVLIESEEKFRSLTESALVGITLIQNGVYRYVNPAMAEMIEYTREELLGTSPKRIVHPEDWPQVKMQIESRLEGEALEVRYETRVLTQSGETRHVEVAGSRMTYQGEPAVIATIQDVTEHRRMRRELIQVQEEERRRIGQELHDGVASQLTGAWLRLSTLSDRVEEESLSGRIRDIGNAIEESTGELRRLSRGLRPGGLSEGDLLGALRGLATNTEEARFECPLQDGLADLERRLTSVLEEETATHLYRIAQEAVSNARVHGQGGDIVIRLREDEGLFLEIKDDGPGFDLDSFKKDESLGLHSMRHRADLIGADLTIESAPGEGTLIRVQLPV